MNQTLHHGSQAPTVLRLIRGWHALAGRQTEAIQRSDWPGVMRLGYEKQTIKELIDVAIRAAEIDRRDEHPRELRQAVEELAELEQHNRAALVRAQPTHRGRVGAVARKSAASTVDSQCLPERAADTLALVPVEASHERDPSRKHFPARPAARGYWRSTTPNMCSRWCAHSWRPTAMR